MEIAWFAHCTNDDGVAEDGSVLPLFGSRLMSHPEGGCGDPGCNCSPGHWIVKNYPRTADGIVAGFHAKFDSRDLLERAEWRQIESAALAARH